MNVSRGLDVWDPRHRNIGVFTVPSTLTSSGPYTRNWVPLSHFTEGDLTYLVVDLGSKFGPLTPACAQEATLLGTHEEGMGFRHSWRARTRAERTSGQLCRPLVLWGYEDALITEWGKGHGTNGAGVLLGPRRPLWTRKEVGNEVPMEVLTF